MLFRRVICCPGGLYAFQEGYMLFRRVICCSGGLYAVQEGYMQMIDVKGYLNPQLLLELSWQVGPKVDQLLDKKIT